MMHTNASSTATDVEILGSGPYGLSIAAHLNPLKVTYQIFGCPMQSWKSNMPKGMPLKSDGFASCLYDPDGAFMLGHNCAETNQPYGDVGIPMPVETFTAYGFEFQKRLVPNLGQVELISVKLRVRSHLHVAPDLQTPGRPPRMNRQFKLQSVPTAGLQAARCT
jgi:hypothetical protein